MTDVAGEEVLQERMWAHFHSNELVQRQFNISQGLHMHNSDSHDGMYTEPAIGIHTVVHACDADITHCFMCSVMFCLQYYVRPSNLQLLIVPFCSGFMKVITIFGRFVST